MGRIYSRIVAAVSFLITVISLIVMIVNDICSISRQGIRKSILRFN